jgi:D-sedoheptulose 7-phosphate isomerase
MKQTYSKNFLNLIQKITQSIDDKKIDNLAKKISLLRKKKGRLFFLGVGGSAANCSHAVNDFRKICNIESYSPLDNVAELTARINDEGWDSSLKGWLKVSNLNKNDAIFVFSVGGGNKAKRISTNLISAIDYAKKTRAQIFGVIGKKNGYLNKKGDEVILIPEVNIKKVTPLSEAYQAVVWHCLVSHPILQKKKNKW